MYGFDPSLEVVRRLDGRLLSARAFVDLLSAVLSRGVDFRMRASGFSMHPFIRDGDILTLRRISEIRLGDVVAFAHPETGKLIVHRVIARSGERFLIKGDFAMMPDGWLSVKQILAAVIQVERGNKRVTAAPFGIRKLLALFSRCIKCRRLTLLIWRCCKKAGEFY